MGLTCRFGCGRQALKMMDHEAHYEASHLATAAAKWLHEPGAGLSDMKHLADYVAKVRKSLQLLVEFDAAVPDVMSVSLMKQGIEKLLKLDAPIAAAYAAWRQSTDTGALPGQGGPRN